MIKGKAWMKRLRKKSSSEKPDEIGLRSDIQLLSDFYSKKGGNICPPSSTTQQGEDVLDVVIVGAGWAGISAAMTLQANGIENFQILEARDYVGGRSRTIYETFDGEDIPIDLGSMWILGGKNNPIHEIATIVGDIPTVESQFTEQVYLEINVGALTEHQLNSHLINLFENGFMPFQAERQESIGGYKDESLQVSVDKYVDTLPTKLEKDLAINFIKNEIELDYSAPLNELSLKLWDEDSYLGENLDLFLPEGYSPLTEAYAAPIIDKIVMEATVTKIDYRKSTIKCIYSTCGNTYTLKSKKIIVSVPLGVLKANSIKFVPQLPRCKRRSIKRLGMGQMNKIFMFWNHLDVFWPREKELYSDVVQRDVYFQFFNPMQYNGGKPMLFAFFAGSVMEDIENKSNYEQEMTDKVMVSLRNMFGNDIKDPEKVIVTNWNNDEFSYGTYSFNKLKAGRKSREQLAAPIWRKGLYITGEATSSKYFQTTHGAYWSGISSAEKVIKSLSKHSKK